MFRRCFQGIGAADMIGSNQQLNGVPAILRASVIGTPVRILGRSKMQDGSEISSRRESHSQSSAMVRVVTSVPDGETPHV